jgi:hypothetical protein
MPDEFQSKILAQLVDIFYTSINRAQSACRPARAYFLELAPDGLTCPVQACPSAGDVFSTLAFFDRLQLTSSVTD